MNDMYDWPCPQLSPHPPGRSARPTVELDWRGPQPFRSRVLGYTCSCRTIVYELLASGGMYVIRRTYQTTPRRIAYAGPWSRRTAERMWSMLLSGEASLRLSQLVTGFPRDADT